MQITAVHVEDYKRIRKVEIRPGCDRALVLIGGRNAQGKSSLLDALTVAFGGKAAAAADPVRHGAELADIRVELDNGALTVRRTIEPDGASKLEVREDGVAVRAPQAVLDRLVGARFLDPLAFLALDPARQRARILEIVGNADQLAELDRRHGLAFDARRDHGRDLKRLEAQLAGLPDEADLDLQEPGEVDGAARLAAELKECAAAAAAAHVAATYHRTKVSEHASALATTVRLREDIERLQASLAHAEAEVAVLGADVERGRQARAAAEAAAAAAEARRAELTTQAARLDARNRERAAAEAAARRRAELVAEVEAIRGKHAHAEAVLEAVKKARAELLAAAALPVPGLSIDDAGVTLNGVPFGQASAAERLRVALALAMAGAPGLRDVWVRDGALLDEDSLGAVAELAEEMGVRVWIERVGTADPGAIVIRDGEVL